MGGLSARPVECLLISQRVSAGKNCAFMTLLSYLLSIRWRKYQYNKLINESLASFLLYLPYRKCWLNVDLTRIHQMLQRLRLASNMTNGPSGTLISAYTVSTAPRKPQPVMMRACRGPLVEILDAHGERVFICSRDKRTPSSVT